MSSKYSISDLHSPVSYIIKTLMNAVDWGFSGATVSSADAGLSQKTYSIKLKKCKVVVK